MNWTAEQVKAIGYDPKTGQRLPTSAKAARKVILTGQWKPAEPQSPVGPLRAFLPLRLPSLPNTRLHPLRLYRLLKMQRNAVMRELRRHIRPSLPATVTLTRLGPRRLDPDNLAASFKACQDSIAAWIGVDDGSPLYVWTYAQEKSDVYGLRIEVVREPPT